MSEQLHAGCHAALEAQAVEFRTALANELVQDAEKGRFGEFHGDSRSIRSMAEAALTIRLLAEARSSVLWAIDRAREADDAREGE